MDETKPQAWLRYFDYKEMMTKKARLENQDVEELVAFNDGIRAWATSEYPQQSQLYIAHLADYVTWDRFFDPRDNPVKAPHKYVRKDAPKAGGDKEIPVTEPYTSVERQLVVAFTESFPNTPLLTFYSYHDSFESEFTGRTDLSSAEQKWAAEKATWTHFWTSPALQEHFPFPGTQPKLITNQMVRQKILVPRKAKSPTKEIEQGKSGNSQKDSFPKEIEALIGGWDLHKSPKQDDQGYAKQGGKGNRKFADKTTTPKSTIKGIRRRRELAPSPGGGRDHHGERRNKSFGIDGNLPTAANVTSSIDRSNGTGSLFHTLTQAQSVHDLHDPYHETRPRGAAHVSQMPSLLACETDVISRCKEVEPGTIQRIYNFRLSTYMKDPMHNDKTIGELEAFAQSDAFDFVDKCRPPRAEKRKRDAESSSDSLEGENEEDEVFDFTADLANSSTFGTPRSGMKPKDLGERISQGGEGIISTLSQQQGSMTGPAMHGHPFQQQSAPNPSFYTTAFPFKAPGEGERVPRNSVMGGATESLSNDGASMQNSNEGWVNAEEGNGAAGNPARQDNAAGFSNHVPDFTFKNISKGGKPGRKQKQPPQPDSDPFHLTRPVASLVAPVRLDSQATLLARTEDNFASTFPNFRPNSIKHHYSSVLKGLLADSNRQYLTVGELESLAEEKTMKHCDKLFVRFAISNPPEPLMKGDDTLFLVTVPKQGKKGKKQPKPAKPPKKKSKKNPN